MILTRHFVHLHVPKTGGSFFTHLVENYAPPEWEAKVIRHHPDADMIPDTHRGLPVWGMVRSPWSFYVSWYHFALQRWQDWPFLQKVSGGGKLGFKETIVNVQESDEVKQAGFGGYTMQLVHIYKDLIDETRFVHMENLRQEMRAVLEELCELPPAMSDAIDSMPKVNVGRYGNTIDYYDDELEQLIWERDKPVFEKFGYGRLREEHGA